MVAHEAHLRSRVERFLKGPFNPEDISVIYKGLRWKSVGIESVKELGNFEAHSDTKDKGLVTDKCRNHFAYFKFIYPCMGGILELYQPSMHFKRAMRTSLERADYAELKRQTGLRRKDAHRQLEATLAKYTEVDGRYEDTGDVSFEEVKLLRFLSSHFKMEPLFTQRSLANDLANNLLKNKLLRPDEKNTLLSKSQLIALYAASLMHRTGTIVLEHNETAELAIGLDDKERIVLGASIMCSRPGSPDINFAVPIFRTDMPGQDYIGGDIAFQLFSRYWPQLERVMNSSSVLRLA